MTFPTPAGGAPVDGEPICGCGKWCIEHARHELELARARAEAAEARALAAERRLGDEAPRPVLRRCRSCPWLP